MQSDEQKAALLKVFSNYLTKKSFILKFQPDSIQAAAVVVGYDESSVTINATRFTGNVMFGSTLAPTVWAVDGLNDESRLLNSIATAARNKADLVLIGTGKKQVFPSIETRRSWLSAGLAVEVMDTAAACRTYNILVSEGRSVLAALIVGQ